MDRILVLGLVGTNIGGIETFLLNMNDAMDKECIFDYVIEEAECVHLSRIRKKGGEVYKIPDRKKHTLENAVGFYKLIKKNQYKTIYFNLSSLSWIALEIIARLCGLRVIVHSHNAELIDANSSFVYKTMNAMNRLILNNIGIERLACSDYAARFMFGRNKDYLVINNGIFVERFKYSETLRKKWRDIYDIKDDLVIGFVGRLAYQKNPLFAIEIFSEIRKRIECKFLIAGDGALAYEAKLHADELGVMQDIIFLGNVKDANELYSVMDFFLFPSRHEGLGIVLIEAQANGLRGLTSEVVVPDETFVTDLFEKESLSKPASEWARHCLRMIGEELSIDRKSYNSAVAQAGFDIEIEAHKLQKILFERETTSAKAENKARAGRITNRKKGLFITTMCYEKESNENSGVWKKILAEYRAFKSRYNVRLIEAAYRTNKVRRALTRLPLFPGSFDASKIKIDIRSIDFVYFRYDMGDLPSVLFLKKLKTVNPECKIILEIPTYPLNLKALTPKWHQLVHRVKNNIWKNRLKAYADRAVVYGDYDKVYGIPTIKTINGFEIEKEKIKDYTQYSDDAVINLISVSNMLNWHGLDRAITGLKEYLESSKIHRKIMLHFVGSGNEERRLKDIVKELGIQENVIFYGYRYGKDLDEIYDKCDIGIEVLGFHRNGYPKSKAVSSTLKSREYLAKGMPMISEAIFDGHYDDVRDYILEVPYDESPLDFNKIIKFYEFCFKGKSRGETENKLRDFAKTAFDYKKTLDEVFTYIDSNGK